MQLRTLRPAYFSGFAQRAAGDPADFFEAKVRPLLAITVTHAIPARKAEAFVSIRVKPS